MSLTVRQVASHMSGIRHYDKDCGKKKKYSTKNASKDSPSDSKKIIGDSIRSTEAVKDSRYHEFYLKKHFSSVEESLNLFKDDHLCHKPGM